MEFDNMLEAAHLAMLRRDYTRARSLAEMVRQNDATNNLASKLLEELDERENANPTPISRRPDWLDGFEPSGWQLAVIAIASILCLLVGAFSLATAVIVCIHQGLTTEVIRSYGNAPGSGRYPAHLLLLQPLMELGLGCFGLRCVYRLTRG